MIRAFDRVLAFYRKEFLTVVRQARLVGSLVLGPFLILLIFGLGFRGGQAPITTILVVPDAPGTNQDIATYRERFGQGSFNVIGTTPDETEARAALLRREVEAVVVLPKDPFAAIYGGSPAMAQILTNQIDPVRQTWVQYNTFVNVSEINRTIMVEVLRESKSPMQRLDELAAELEADAQALSQEMADGNIAAALARAERMRTNVMLARQAADEALRSLDAAGQSIGAQAAAEVTVRITRHLDELDAALAAVVDGLRRSDANSAAQQQNAVAVQEATTALRAETTRVAAIPAEVLVSPFAAEAVNVAPSDPDYVAFFAPAVIALLLQHLSLTLLSLSIVRERLLGTTQFFKVSPVPTTTIIVGKALSYATMGMLLAALLVALVHFGLGVPVIGRPVDIFGSIVVLLFASLGVGFLIATVSQTENQAVQLAMLTLIASVFFGGFFINIDSLLPFARGVSYLLPVTYGIQDLQDVMLRGARPIPLYLLAPIAIGAVTFTIGAIRFRRELRST